MLQWAALWNLEIIAALVCSLCLYVRCLMFCAADDWIKGEIRCDCMASCEGVCDLPESSAAAYLDCTWHCGNGTFLYPRPMQARPDGRLRLPDGHA